MFTINIVSAENLIAKDSTGKSDPFCVLKVKNLCRSRHHQRVATKTFGFSAPVDKSSAIVESFKTVEVARTGIVFQNLNPRWNYEFTASFENSVELQLEVKDYDAFNVAEMCGTAFFALSAAGNAFNDFQVHELWLDLHPQGKVQLRIQKENSRRGHSNTLGIASMTASDGTNIEYFFRKAFRELKRCSADICGLMVAGMREFMEKDLIKIAVGADREEEGFFARLLFGKAQPHPPHRPNQPRKTHENSTVLFDDSTQVEQEHFGGISHSAPALPSSSPTSPHPTFSPHHHSMSTVEGEKSANNSATIFHSKSLISMNEAENAIHYLTVFLNDALAILAVNLYPRLCRDVLRRCWREILSIMEMLMLPSLYGDNPSISLLVRAKPLHRRQVQMISMCCEELKMFFNAVRVFPP